MGFFIAPGISNNRFKRLDHTTPRSVLYDEPSDDAFATPEA